MKKIKLLSVTEVSVLLIAYNTYLDFQADVEAGIIKEYCYDGKIFYREKDAKKYLSSKSFDKDDLRPPMKDLIGFEQVGTVTAEQINKLNHSKEKSIGKIVGVNDEAGTTVITFKPTKEFSEKYLEL